MAVLDLEGNVLDLKTRRGDDILFYLPTEIDLSAWTFSADVRAQKNSTSQLIGSFTFVATAEGVTCRLDRSVTRNLPDTAYYDIQIVSPGETQQVTPIYGKIQASEDVTP